MYNFFKLFKSPLKHATFENTPTFSLNGLNKKCKILNIYDGDTLWLTVTINSKLYKLKIRMKGYDSPEMKPSLDNPDRNYEILAANGAKLYLESLILNKIVDVKFFNYDKYGRPLCEIYINKKNKCFIPCTTKKLCVNQLMIDSGHGYIYNGGKKKKFNKSP